MRRVITVVLGIVLAAVALVGGTNDIAPVVYPAQAGEHKPTRAPKEDKETKEPKEKKEKCADYAFSYSDGHSDDGSTCDGWNVSGHAGTLHVSCSKNYDGANVGDHAVLSWGISRADGKRCGGETPPPPEPAPTELPRTPEPTTPTPIEPTPPVVFPDPTPTPTGGGEVCDTFPTATPTPVPTCSAVCFSSTDVGNQASGQEESDLKYYLLGSAIILGASYNIGALLRRRQ